jgi:Glycosyl transferases group 1
MLGLLRSCESMGLEPVSIEVGPIIKHLSHATDPFAALGPIFARLRTMIEVGNYTDIITYANAGGIELGKHATAQGDGTIWTALGLRHHILWTDHPEWATDATALKPYALETYSHPRIFHYLKSAPAAREAAAILGWANIHALPVAEDYETLGPTPQAQPRHDVVTILGSVARLPEELEPILADDDPDPARLDRAMIPRTLDAWNRIAESAPDPDAIRRFAAAVLEARAQQPCTTIWEHTWTIQNEFAPVIHWLEETPDRWYAAVGKLRLASAWRRSFWLAWLARRVDLGVYGCDASALGIAQPDDALKWVEYKEQPRVYAYGRCALNINQAHDEAGVTHKPFQIIASGVPLIHHATAGLTDLFNPGSDILVFARGPELLHRIDGVCADNTKGPALAQAALTRAKAEHTWTNRVQTMLAMETVATATKRTAA